MAIERKKPIAFDEVIETETVEEGPNAEGIDNETVDAAEAVEAAPVETGGETVTIGLDMLGGKKVAPGDVVRLEVASVSDEDGTAVLKYSTPKSGGIAQAAAVFNEGK